MPLANQAETRQHRPSLHCSIINWRLLLCYGKDTSDRRDAEDGVDSGGETDSQRHGSAGVLARRTALQARLRRNSESASGRVRRRGGLVPVPTAGLRVLQRRGTAARQHLQFAQRGHLQQAHQSGHRYYKQSINQSINQPVNRLLESVAAQGLD